MKFLQTPIHGVSLIEPKVFGDARGFFMESWRADRFAEAGIEADFVQDNHSRSRQWTLRGLHLQVAHTQGKLVRVPSGSVFDVVVDLRSSSPSFGAWWGVELSAENQRMLWVPPGLAHGILDIGRAEDDAHVRMMQPDTAGDLQSTHAGHVDVHADEGGDLLFDYRQRIVAADSLGDAPVRAQVGDETADHHARHLAVVDDQ